MFRAHDLINQRTQALLALCLLLSLSETIAAGGRETQVNRENPVGYQDDALSQQPGDSETQEASPSQQLDGSVSMEDRMRLRRDLDEYSRAVDPSHSQIEERRRAMRQRILERFNEADKDNDGYISREEATESLPQIARHFSQVDLNNDGFISVSELEAAQARALERQRAALAKSDGQDADSGKRKGKDTKDGKDTKEAKETLVNRKRSL